MVLFPFFTNGQNIDTLCSQVSDLQQDRIEHIFTDERDAVFSRFDSAFSTLVRHSELCQSNPRGKRFLNADSISDFKGVTLAYAFMNDIVVCQSDDKQVSVFSVDDLNGGSGHTYTCFLNWNLKNSCLSAPFDTSIQTIDVGYFRIYKLPIKKKSVYLMMGYGTYGAGKHHYLLKTIEIDKNQITDYMGFKTSSSLLVGSNRAQDIALKYDPNTFTLSFKQYAFDPEIDFYSKQFEEIILSFDEDVFGNVTINSQQD